MSSLGINLFSEVRMADPFSTVSGSAMLTFHEGRKERNEEIRFLFLVFFLPLRNVELVDSGAVL